MTNTVNNKLYDFIGKLSIALHSQEITISLDSLKHILVDNLPEFFGMNYLELSRHVPLAYQAWEQIDPVVHQAIAYTFKYRKGNFPWVLR